MGDVEHLTIDTQSVIATISPRYESSSTIERI